MRRWLRKFLLGRMAPLETFEEIEAVLPDAAIEAVGKRAELVIYTGWEDNDAGALQPMREDA